MSAKAAKSEKMSKTHFRSMDLMFRVIDFLYPYIDKRVQKFGIEEGMTVVDYGCGTGRYTTRFSQLVGRQGKVFAVDIHEPAVSAVLKKARKCGLDNIEVTQARGYESTLLAETADLVCAIDIFSIIQRPSEFLSELSRIAKNDGVLVIDDGHQSRSETKDKLLESGLWVIVEETADHLRCRRRRT